MPSGVCDRCRCLTGWARKAEQRKCPLCQGEVRRATLEESQRLVTWVTRQILQEARKR